MVFSAWSQHKTIVARVRTKKRVAPRYHALFFPGQDCNRDALTSKTAIRNLSHSKTYTATRGCTVHSSNQGCRTMQSEFSAREGWSEVGDALVLAPNHATDAEHDARTRCNRVFCPPQCMTRTSCSLGDEWQEHHQELHMSTSAQKSGYASPLIAKSNAQRKSAPRAART